MESTIKRRFIAGAVCPQCRAVDRIVLETSSVDTDQTLSRRSCVDCGFAEDLAPDTQATQPSTTPTSRLLRPSRGDASQPVAQPVRLLDPGKPAAPKEPTHNPLQTPTGSVE